MKNKEKYKTVEQANMAYKKYRDKTGCLYPRCRGCEQFKKGIDCRINWMYEEAEEEKEEENLPGQMDMKEFIGD